MSPGDLEIFALGLLCGVLLFALVACIYLQGYRNGQQ